MRIDQQIRFGCVDEKKENLLEFDIGLIYRILFAP